MKIFLIEDSEADSILFREQMAASGLPHEIKHVESGEQAFRLLLTHKGYTPSLVVLDLSLPGMHGLEVLKRFKEKSALATIPVVILTGSTASEDLETAKNMGANGYILKSSFFKSSDILSLLTLIINDSSAWIEIPNNSD